MAPEQARCLLEGEFLLCLSWVPISVQPPREVVAEQGEMLQSQKHMYPLQNFAKASVNKALMLVWKFSFSFPHLLIPYCWQLLLLLRKL